MWHSSPVAEVRGRVLGPLVRLGEQHAIREARVDVRAQLLQELVRRGQVLAVRPLRLVQVGDGVEAQSVDALAEPEVDDAEQRLVHRRVLEVQIGLVGVEAVPEVAARDRIPRPVRRLEVLEDDARLPVALGGVAPDVEVAFDRPGRGAARALEPRVLVGRVVEDQLGDDAEAARVRLARGTARSRRACRPRDGRRCSRRCRSRRRAAATDRTAAARSP